MGVCSRWVWVAWVTLTMMRLAGRPRSLGRRARRTEKAQPSEAHPLTLLHTECTECPLGPVGSNNLLAAQSASHSLRRRGHLWETGSHLRGPVHTKAKKQGRGAEHANFQKIRKWHTNLVLELCCCAMLQVFIVSFGAFCVYFWSVNHCVSGCLQETELNRLKYV